MSLQVWLPLNGSLNNQGLNGENPTLMGTGVTYTAGKIGQAATFPNNCNSCIHMPGLKLQIGSWCAWIKVLGEGSSTSQRIISEGRDTGSIGTNIWINKAGTSLTAHTHKKALTTTINLNEWVHIALTFGDGNMKLYKNGQLITSTTYTEDTDYAQSNDRLVLGKMSYSYTNTSNYFPFNGQLNDVRIYDHVLSDKEVEELAKGLVLHYKLNESNSNLLYTMPKSFSAAAYNAYQFNMTENLVANQTYTLQLWDVDVYHSAKTAAQTGVWVYWGGGSVHLFNWAGPTYFTQEGTNNYHADYLVKTFTPTSTNASGNGATNAWFNIYNSVSNADGTRNMHIGAWKLEKGSVATPWKDSADNNIVYDSSGYNNNGTITGTLVNSSLNTPRYNYSAIFNGTERITTNSLPAETKTLTCWAKTTKNKSTSQQIIADSNSALTISFYNGTIIGVFGTTRNTGSKCTLGTEYKENDWNFFAVVKTSEDGKRDIYCNGVKLTPTSNDYWSAATGFFVGARNTSQGNPFYGEINDIRAYVTALTSEQILELYNTSATIDNNGNIYSRELVES